MKQAIYLILFLTVWTNSSWAQNYLSNYSADRAYNLCYNVHDTVFNSNNGFVCLGGSSTLYYSFTTNAAFTWGTPIVLQFRATTGASHASSYKVYGPFESGEDFGAAIANGTASVIIDDPMSTPTGYWKPVDQVNTIANKKYILAITVPGCSGTLSFYTHGADFICSELFDCENCLPKFQPVDDRYVVSAWIKEDKNPKATTYTNGYLRVTSGTAAPVSFYGSGQIIDGWQRIEGIVHTDNAGNLKIELLSNAGDVFFDDIRVFPFDGSMVTYVYDPKTLRLVAELDERNYAKIYEYDEEGKLVRVKKETEKGIMTIQQNLENTSTGF
ncbi:hypothetical protein [Fluviicola sp.]|uniref:hypothetical protein n=1 Tax=Fluviicola sp. TaxID=1917219 RepID=UPI0031D33DA9